MIAVVTGAASGIGRALAEALGRRGAVVIVSDLNAGGAKAVADAIVAAGGRAESVTTDVSREADVTTLVDATLQRHGRVDLMINNAGIAVGGEVRDLIVADWRRIIDVNLLGVVHGVAAASPRMVAQGSGHILNIASLAGLGPWPTMAPYATTKFAVVGLSLSLRAEAASLGVRVSVACPGFVQSGIYEAAAIANADVHRLWAKIPFPFYARVLWWLGRINGALMTPLHRRTIADFRAVRRG